MVMDETHVVNQMKEDMCYVTSDFYADVETARFSFTFMSFYIIRLLAFDIKAASPRPLREQQQMTDSDL